MLPPAISWPTRTDHFTPRVQFSLPYNPSQLETRANYPRNQDIPFRIFPFSRATAKRIEGLSRALMQERDRGNRTGESCSV